MLPPVLQQADAGRRDAAACGLGLDGELLALAAASHSGEDFHVTGVQEDPRRRRPVTEDALQCPPALPLDEAALWRFLRAGGKPDRVHMNCSGKHAAMLATCVDDRLAEPRPTATRSTRSSARSRRRLADLTGEAVAATGVDGCGAPLFALSLTGLARAFRALVLAAPGFSRTIASPMPSVPIPHGPRGRTARNARSTRRFPGCCSSPGPRACNAFALADGRAGAVKIEDGSPRAIPAITVALLRILGVDQDEGVDRGALDQVADLPVLGGGQPVGEIRATLPSIAGRTVPLAPHEDGRVGPSGVLAARLQLQAQAG